MSGKQAIFFFHFIVNALKIIIFLNFSFPKDISEITCNEDELRVAINYGVRNLYGVRSYTFTPHMMFETIVKDEITRLEKPIRICVEAVLELLSVAIRTCILRVS